MTSCLICRANCLIRHEVLALVADVGGRNENGWPNNCSIRHSMRMPWLNLCIVNIFQRFAHSSTYINIFLCAENFNNKMPQLINTKKLYFCWNNVAFLNYIVPLGMKSIANCLTFISGPKFDAFDLLRRMLIVLLSVITKYINKQT